MSQPAIDELIRDLRGAKRLFRPDWDKRIIAARRLGELRASQAVNDLAAVIDENENAELCQVAVQALGQIGGAQAIDALARVLQDKRRGGLHTVAVAALSEIDDEQAVAVLIGVCKTADPPLREAVRKALIALGPGRTFETLIASLGGAVSPARQVAVSVLRQEPSITPLLAEALRHKDDRTRDTVRDLLVHRGSAAVPDLVAVLGHADESVREGAVDALVKMGEVVVPELIPLVTGDDEGAAEAASAALVRIGAPAVRSLLEFLPTHPGLESLLNEMREPVSVALKNLSAKDTVLLMVGLELGDARLRNQASERLIDLGPSAVPLLLEALESEKSVLAEGAAHTLAQIGEPALEPIVSALGDPEQGAEAAERLALIADLDERYLDRLAEGGQDSEGQPGLELDRKPVQRYLLLALGRESREEPEVQSISRVLQSLLGGDARSTVWQSVSLIMGGASMSSLYMGLAVVGWPPEELRRSLTEVETGLRAILRLDQELSIAHCWLGDMHAIRGRAREAIACYERSLRLGVPLDVDMPRPFWQGAADAANELAAEEGRVSPALPLFSPWEESAEARFFFRLGMFHMGLAEPSNPWHMIAERAESNASLAPHERDTSHYPLAVPHLQKAIELGLVTGKIGGTVFDVERALGFCAQAGSLTALEEGEWEQVLELLRTAARSYERYITYCSDASKADHARENLDMVRQELARFELLGQNQALWEFERANLLLDMQEHDRARKVFDASLGAGLVEVKEQVEEPLRQRLDRGDGPAKEIVADVLVQLAEMEVAGRPDDADAHRQLAELCLEMASGQAKGATLEKAVLHFERAIDLGADKDALSGPLARAALDAASHYLLRGVHLERVPLLCRKGIAQAEGYLAAHPDDKSLAGRLGEWQELAAELDELGDHEAALLQRRHALKMIATCEAARQAKLIAPSLKVQADIADGTLMGLAIAALQEAIRLYPGYVLARQDLATVYEQQEQFRQAADVLEEGIRVAPDSWQLYAVLGHIQYSKLDQSQAAIETYRRGLELNPSWAVGHSTLAAALLTTGQDRKAVEHAQKALELDPNMRGIHFLLGVAHLAIGNLEAGTREFAAAIKESPEALDTYLEWLNGEGGAYAERLSDQGRADEALRLKRLITAPLEEASKRGLKRIELAKAYALLSTRYGPLMNTHDLLQGYDACISLAERAVALDESQPMYRRMLAAVTSDKGRYFLRMYDYDAGVSWAKRAIEIDPTYAEAWGTAMACYQGIGDERNMMICIEQAAKLGDPLAIQFLQSLRGY